jgi:polar amino acid transport system substrate-binding protein
MSQSSIAPGGRLRAALNLGNRNLVRLGPDNSPEGITVDLARGLAEHLGVSVEFILFERAAAVTANGASDWDICFLANDAARADIIAFSRPYVRLEGRYVVAETSPAQSSEDIEKLGLVVAALRGSAYSLHLLRHLPADKVLLCATKPEVRAAMAAGTAQAEVFMGPIPSAGRIEPGLRALPDPFLAVDQAIGVPVARAGAIDLVNAFLDHL